VRRVMGWIRTAFKDDRSVLQGLRKEKSRR